MAEHVAKRSPKCSECRRTIAGGETYHRETVGFWRGMPIVKSFCEQCYAARVSAFEALVGGNGDER